MKKCIFIFFILLSQTVFAQNIELKIKAPEKVYSGSDFVVNAHINKGTLEGFGRLTIKIPSGFTPIEKQSAKGKFEFDGSNLKVIWLKLPDETQFTVSFSLKAAPNLEGFKVLRGKMSVASSEKTFHAEARPHIITVKKTDNITTADSVVFQYSYIQEKGVSAIRQKPYLNDSNEAIINILVNKGQHSGFGKIEETVPASYTAESLISNSAIFVFNKNNRKVKFLWMNMPAVDNFVISYKLIPDKGKLDNIPFIITGEFMYAEGSTTKKVKILERNIDLKKMLSD